MRNIGSRDLRIMTGRWLGVAILFYLIAFVPLGVTAQRDRHRSYTAENPLVYEDVWDLWPYCFLNENGQPDGFNVELIRLIFQELNIPYTIKLKSRQEAFNDLRDGKSDLTMALSAGYHDEYGQYGRNTITLFTQSVATPKGKPVEIFNLKDLGKHKVIVNDNSLSHHLMIDYGWGENAIPTKDIKGAIQNVSADEDGQIIWNTLSLKWLIRQNQIDNLQVTPVNMPHGEYKFMSNDPRLLATLDSIYTVLSTDDKLLDMQNKWFYPERQERVIPQWVWYLVSVLGVLGLILVVYVIVYRQQAKRITKDNNKRNKRLALIMDTCKVRVWTYDVHTKLFTWHNAYGQAVYTYTSEEFSSRYHPDDFRLLMKELQKLERQKAEDDDKYVTVNLKAIDLEDDDDEWRDFVVTLSVLRRDEAGRPWLIIGTKKDITNIQLSQREVEERMLRYWAVCDTPLLGIMLFDKDGTLVNLNHKACSILCCDHDEIVAEKVTIYDILRTTKEDFDHKKADGYSTMLIVDFDKIPPQERRIKSVKHTGKIYNEIQLKTIKNDEGEQIGLFAFCRDITSLSQRKNSLRMEEAQLEKKNAELDDYIGHINYILQKGNVRLVSYSPVSHTLTVFSSVGKIQLSLTQARCMTFVDNRYQRKAMHMLSDMDACIDKVVEGDIRTTIRGHGRLTLHLQFCMTPVKDKSGKVTEYNGLCQDVSEEKKTENLMMIETIKAHEIENTQNKFLRNMMQELRTPLNVIVELAANLQPEYRNDDDNRDNDIILNNAHNLLGLINNILFLSRLEAHMVEINKQPTDFADVFKTFCMAGWSQHRVPSVRYTVENPYEHLVVDIDATNLQHIIERVAALSARHTFDGSIRARYDYIGRKLMISMDDTGEGISEELLQKIETEYSSSSHSVSDLDLFICKELIDQMGGTFEINSEKGLGTTVWITIPCQATNIKRRKFI